MNLVQKLMGRRQFLIATGVASTCALTCKKLAGFEAGTAMAAEKAAIANIKAAGNKCPHLLSPLRIRNVVLKNRIMHTVSPTYFMQGPENFPAEMYRNHYSNIAKNAAIVSMSTHYGTYPKTYVKGQHGPSANFCDDIWQDIPPVQNYVERLVEDIHCEGALILFVGNTGGQGNLGVPGAGIVPAAGGTSGAAQQGGAPGGQGGMPGGAPGGQGGMPGAAAGGQGGMPGAAAGGQGGMPGAAAGGQGGPGGAAGGPGGRGGMSTKTDDEILAEAKEAEATGYDIYQLNSSSIEVAKKVRAATNLILMSSLRMGMGGYNTSAKDGNQPTAAELEQAVEAAKKLEGIVDYVQIRVSEHPNAWNQDEDKPKALAYAEAIKKAGVKVLVCPTAGFHDVLANDTYIANGQADMIGMTTPFFADRELVRKVKEGRADDINYCIACWNCHGISMTKGPWYSTCTVDPTWGLPPYKLQGITAPRTKKKVAVIGGGPAGMKAALTAAERGHKVTLYEKDATLGGLLKIADKSKTRWTFRKYKEWLIAQVKKSGIDVKTGTTATPDMIKTAGFDAVLVGTGAEPVISKMKVDGAKSFNILEAYAKKDELGQNVVVIGAGKYGFELALGLAMDGHKVTNLSSTSYLFEPDFQGPHNMQNQEGIYKTHPNFSYALNVVVKDVTGGKVTYKDSTGAEKSVQADSVVIWSGLKPRLDEASKFLTCADEVYLMGDCTGKNGHLQKAIRSAFFTASQV
jgi:2,4-dienoyl-CoA reductase-like NADH-dependent reductase (Old Yellow Enzyme family)/thioredoxin reductase